MSVDLVHRFDADGPRYTSFPTADRFVETFTSAHYVQALKQRRSGLVAGFLPLSLYVHIPFCRSLCYYCACNKIITRQRSDSTAYLRYLSCEVDLHTQYIGVGRSIGQMHLGGGSPTFFSDDELRELMALLRRSFRFAAGGEFSIEIDPRTVDADRIAALAQMGFNRLSFGVQDFDPAVQKAVHRVQPIERVFAVVAAARACDFESVSVDLIYGLPRQSPDSFDRTVAQIKLLRPDRIALYRYAHLPDQFKSQRRMPIADLPSAEAKGLMLSRSLLSLQEAGYIQVGVDLLALPTDPLAVAKRQGRLHRNFQGYSAQLEGDVIGLGLSANGRIGSTYSQNATSLTAYCDCLDQGQFPIVRGLTLARDDLIRRAVIMAIMCQGQVLFESIDLAFLVDSRSYFSQELDALQELIDQGIVSIDDSGIQVAKMDWPFLRAVSMVFDRYLQADRNRTQFSKML